MADWQDDRAFTLELLQEVGQPITAKKDVVSDSDVTTGSVTDSVDTQYTGWGYPSNYRLGLIDGITIKAGDIKLIFYTDAIPEVTDIITISNKDYTALNVQKITEQGFDVLYLVQCRA